MLAGVDDDNKLAKTFILKLKAIGLNPSKLLVCDLESAVKGGASLGPIFLDPK